MKSSPSMELWLQEAKSCPNADKIGMILSHNGIVRGTSKAAVRHGEAMPPVCALKFSYDQTALDAAVARTMALDGIYFVRVWLNEGTLQVGDDLMYVMVGGDIRPRVMGALESLLSELKTVCVKEMELYK